VTRPARVLSIAGSDPSGGAGVQADIKTITALGGYASAAITALTVQNTTGVERIEMAPADLVAQQISAVLCDVGADAIKIGMLGNKQNIDAVQNVLLRWKAKIPIVIDPVLVASSGDALQQSELSIDEFSDLFQGAALITPNIPEAEILTGRSIKAVEDMALAGRQLLETGANAVLIKGGHLQTDELTDLLVEPGATKSFIGRRIDSNNTHGTGCTLATAIAVSLAQGSSMAISIERAREYVVGAIRAAPGFGEGVGPLDHGHMLRGKD
jgi:hydroxymethylpyrimidine/phosphomethylpyrimidine kinase